MAATPRKLAPRLSDDLQPATPNACFCDHKLTKGAGALASVFRQKKWRRSNGSSLMFWNFQSGQEVFLPEQLWPRRINDVAVFGGIKRHFDVVAENRDPRFTSAPHAHLILSLPLCSKKCIVCDATALPLESRMGSKPNLPGEEILNGERHQWVLSKQLTVPEAASS
jgi:hypothetical protein